MNGLDLQSLVACCSLNALKMLTLAKTDSLLNIRPANAAVDIFRGHDDLLQADVGRPVDLWLCVQLELLVRATLCLLTRSMLVWQGC